MVVIPCLSALRHLSQPCIRCDCQLFSFGFNLVDVMLFDGLFDGLMVTAVELIVNTVILHTTIGVT